MKYVEKVDTKIESALFTLMEKQSLSTITTTQIVAKAKVSRASFYRNFASREEVIQKYIDNIMLDIFDIIQLKHNNILEQLEDVFLLIKEEKTRLAILLNQGYGIEILQCINNKILKYAKSQNGEVSSNSIYIRIGAVFNLAMNWVLNDCKEETKSLCKIVIDTILLRLTKGLNLVV